MLYPGSLEQDLTLVSMKLKKSSIDPSSLIIPCLFV
jgi:hypothetical protein